MIRSLESPNAPRNEDRGRCCGWQLATCAVVLAVLAAVDAPAARADIITHNGLSAAPSHASGTNQVNVGLLVINVDPGILELGTFFGEVAAHEFAYAYETGEPPVLFVELAASNESGRPWSGLTMVLVGADIFGIIDGVPPSPGDPARVGNPVVVAAAGTDEVLLIPGGGDTISVSSSAIFRDGQNASLLILFGEYVDPGESFSLKFFIDDVGTADSGFVMQQQPIEPGACCYADGTCTDEAGQATCEGLGGTWRGHGTTCPTETCQVLPGACCHAVGTCTDEADQATCEGVGGTWRGHGTTCPTETCQVLPGACCHADGTCTDEADQATCEGVGGTWQGHGTTCATETCPVLPGACCQTDGTCTDEADQATCEGVGGTWQGHGTTCATETCPVLPGACCHADGTCTDEADQAACEGVGGTWQGHGTTCATETCPALPGACCLPDGSCQDVADEPACRAAGGVFEGHDTACSSVQCPPPVQLDGDADGVDGTVEEGAPNSGDGNNDGIADGQQANVASLLDILGDYVTIASPSGTTLSQVVAGSNPSPVDAPEAEFPIGFFSFDVGGLPAGGATTVELFLPPGTTVTTYYKFGPTPDNPTPHWYEFLFDGTTGAEISGSRVTLHFVDGQRGDDDLAANGVVVDVGAPASATVSGPGAGPQTTPPPEHLVDREVLRTAVSFLFGVPICGVFGFAYLPFTIAGLVAMKARWNRGLRRRRH